MHDHKALLADETRLRQALALADIVPLALTLFQLSADPELLDRLAPHVRGPFDHQQDLPTALRQEIMDRLVAVLAKGSDALPPLPDDATLTRMAGIAAGGTVPGLYGDWMRTELALDLAPARHTAWTGVVPGAETRAEYPVVIVGAGMSGILMGIKLKAAGIPFTILEKNEGVGGAWFENDYPGCGVDTPNHLYCYSFEPVGEWSRFYSRRAELHRYFDEIVDRYDLRSHIRFRTELSTARFDRAGNRWEMAAQGPQGPRTLDARILVMAVGQLNRPQLPALPGLESFAGPAFHTAEWDRSVDLGGKRVAMIGTGASGMQVAPTIAPEVAGLSIFQRTPHWVAPNPNYHREVPADLRWLMRHLPFYSRWMRFQLLWGYGDAVHPALEADPDWSGTGPAINGLNDRHRRALTRHIEGALADRPDLLAKALPDYPVYGKRILLDNHWFEMLRRDNVQLVTGPVRQVLPDRIIAADGSEHPAEILIFATGFQAAKMLWPVDLDNGAGLTIRAAWGDDDPRAYLGIAAPDFPNMFMLYGPNTNLAHGGSMIFHAECQAGYILQAITVMLEGGHDRIAVRPDVHAAYNARIDDRLAAMVWTQPGVRTWYKNASGRVTTNSPWRMGEYWQLTRHFAPEDYDLAGAA